MKNYNTKSQKSKSIQYLTAIAFLCLMLFSVSTTQAQDTKKTPESDKNIIVKGNVSDENAPLLGVNIVLEGTRIGTVTDIDGNFEFPQKLKKGDVLIFSYIGLKPQKVAINDEDSTSKIELKIDMNMTEVVIMTKMATKKVYSSNRN
ncbi:carboxypeptidase-like regulatory domain-containing protein [Lacinutrix iliipiscaria]|uniref:Carboxypeptidase-like regulatory domain-containing protein n=1 Tax=Lacinutrix iliipiscaria TaxID=1230532 RepID=A0ABW5WLW7_9FLAO